MIFAPGKGSAVELRTSSAMIGFGAQWRWTLTNAQQIPHTRIADRVLFPLAAVRRWREGQMYGNTGRSTLGRRAV